jgi:hypothetical protein
VADIKAVTVGNPPSSSRQETPVHLTMPDDPFDRLRCVPPATTRPRPSALGSALARPRRHGQPSGSSGQAGGEGLGVVGAPGMAATYKTGADRPRRPGLCCPCSSGRMGRPASALLPGRGRSVGTTGGMTEPPDPAARSSVASPPYLARLGTILVATDSTGRSADPGRRQPSDRSGEFAEQEGAGKADGGGQRHPPAAVLEGLGKHRVG